MAIVAGIIMHVNVRKTVPLLKFSCCNKYSTLLNPDDNAGNYREFGEICYQHNIFLHEKYKLERIPQLYPSFRVYNTFPFT